MFDYPIDSSIRDALNRFPVIDSMLNWRTYERNSHDSREIFRLLGNAQWSGADLYLKHIDNNIRCTGEIGKQLLSERDPLKFRQRLAELNLLAFNRTMGRVLATAAAKPRSRKSYDIDIRYRTRRAKVEVYSPIDYYGYQFVTHYVVPLFRYSRCERGFDVRVELVVARHDGYHAHVMSNSDRELRPWLDRLKADVNAWLEKAEVRATNCFDGIDEGWKIKVTLRESSSDPRHRSVEFHEPGRSNDTRRFFEARDPKETASSQIGMKIGTKMCKRQCGNPESDVLRMLVVNFALTDTYNFSWFWWPRISERIDKTVRILSDRCGDPLPYDVVLPANLGVYCCFGKPVVLNPAWDDEAVQLITQAGFAVPCKPPIVREPPPELLEELDKLIEEEEASRAANAGQIG